MACLDNPDAGQKAIAKMAAPARAKGRSFRGFNLFLDPDYRLFLTLVLFPALYRKAVPRYFRTGQDSFSRIIWHRSEHDSASREPVRAPRVSV
jgi:hypothetical protein